jgi:hypothetical protein
MTDEPFTKPGLKIDRTRTPKPGEVLWVAEKGTDVYRYELRDDTELGCGFEFQVFLNDQLVHGQRHEARFLAEAEANVFRETYFDLGYKVTR